MNHDTTTARETSAPPTHEEMLGMPCGCPQHDPMTRAQLDRWTAAASGSAAQFLTAALWTLWVREYGREHGDAPMCDVVNGLTHAAGVSSSIPAAAAADVDASSDSGEFPRAGGAT